ncbi:MAG: AAA family ATPase [Deltaproteobacteria bacterium]|nr:AAA family ATPase [Deltaproteobacteria bacterium]
MATLGANRAAVDFARAALARFLAANAQRGKLTGRSGFGVSGEEIAATLGASVELPAGSLDAEDVRLRAAAEALRVAATSKPEPLLGRLARVFSLTRTDLQIVSLLLAPELEHDLERVISYALDDFTRKRPDLGFVARVLGGGDDTQADAVLRRFQDGAPLRRHGIVTVGPQAPETSSAMRPVRLADRIVSFLRGHDTVDELVHGIARIGARRVTLDEIVMNPEIVARIRRALDHRSGPPRVLLAGPEGVGRSLVVEAILGAQGKDCVKIDLPGVLAEGRIEERIAAALREAALRDAVAIFDGGSAIDKDVPRALVLAISDGIEDLAVPIVFTLTTHPTWLVGAVASLVELDVPSPTFRERLTLWGQVLPPPLATEEQLETVASRYAFTGGVIKRAAGRAASSAELRDPENPAVTIDDLGDAARLMFSHRLGAMAQRIPTGFTWADLVLQKDTMDALKEVVRFGRYRAFLLEEWGFAAKLPYGRGVSAILAGPPGTGKTMVAQLLARELGYDLYRIDLSQVVNKYIGETEKNLAKIFDEAESSHAVLFFDEADSLFAKRTEVKSSNDRYANLEVNYLLQRMETYDGVTLLATNLEQGLDEAFKRRVRFSVQFELPEETERRELWRSMFPPKVPLAPDIDWDMMARKFEMAGGYIKKAALRAALIAAEAKRAITTSDLLEAARLEYREMGRVI